MTVGAMVTCGATGVSFPRVQTFWNATRCTSLGAGPRVRKIAFVAVKVYAITLYVDEAAAKLALAGHSGDEAVCEAVKEGAFTKALQLQLLRDVTDKQMIETFQESLKPKMQGDAAGLEAFEAAFRGRSFPTGTNIVFLWRQPALLDILTCPAGTDLSQATPHAEINSKALCQALWGSFLGASGPTPEARKEWVAGAKALAAA